MGTLNPTPRVYCDNCGVSTEKVTDHLTTVWRKPLEWGHVKVAPTYWGTYPNNIDLPDLCPACNKAVHIAVSAALDARKKEQTP